MSAVAVRARPRGGARRRALAVLVAVLAATALVIPTNAAAPAWTAPVSIPLPGSGTFPQVAVTDEGYGSMVFLYDDGGTLRLRTSTRAPGKAWTAPAALGSLVGGQAPSISADRTSSTAAWVGVRNTRLYAQVARRTRGGGWSKPADLSPAADAVNAPVVASNSRGAAVAIWGQSLQTDETLQVARRSLKGSWSSPIAVSGLSQPPFGAHDVAISETGAMAAIWIASDGANERVTSAYRPPAGPWEIPQMISAPGAHAAEPVIAMAPNGDAVAAWTRSDGTDTRVQAVHRPADGYWQQRTTLSVAGQNASAPALTVDRQARFTAMWLRDNGSVAVAQSRRRAADGSWGPNTNVSPLTGSAAVPALTADSAGNVTAIWQQEQHIYAARRTASGPWASAEPVTAQPEPLVTVLSGLDVDARGNVTTAWGKFDGPTTVVDTASLDVVGPLSRVTAPAAAFSLGPPAVRWTATDEISAITGYRTRVASAPPAGPFTAPATWLGSTTAKTATYSPTIVGRTYCFDARASDAAGHTGAYSPKRCTAVPLDDRALTASPSWTTPARPAAYRGTVTTTTDKAQTLTSAPVNTRRVALVATRAPGAGSVTVYLGKSKLKTINLAAATVRHRQIIPVATFTTRRAGTVRIVTTTTKPVIIDGLGISAT